MPRKKSRTLKSPLLVSVFLMITGVALLFLIQVMIPLDASAGPDLLDGEEIIQDGELPLAQLPDSINPLTIALAAVSVMVVIVLASVVVLMVQRGRQRAPAVHIHMPK